MKKILMMVTIFLLLCGCSNEYNLTIKDGKFTEEINMTIPKSMIPVSPDVEPEYHVEEDDRITPFIKGEQYAYDDKKYEKTVKEDGNNYYVNLKYEYTADEFKNGQALSCFENVTYENNDDYYLINLSGRFYCLYGNESVINIKVYDDVVEENSTMKNRDTYTWVINKLNVKDTNITLKIKKTDKTVDYIVTGLAIAIGIVFVAVASFIVYKVSQRSKVNEI